jgi:hypothetical protein
MQEINEFKIRASAAGSIMTNPRSKSETFSETTLTFVEDWLKEQIYGVKKDFSSKYTKKGITLEDEAIDKSIEWLDLPVVLKNELPLSDEHFTGTPDLILDDEVLDIKCSWDAFTFPLFDNEIPTKDYMYQLQVYMALTGKRKARLVYVLLNTPEEINPYGINPNYDELDKKYRIKTFAIEYDESIISDLRARVEQIREYLLTIKL